MKFFSFRPQRYHVKFVFFVLLAVAALLFFGQEIKLIALFFKERFGLWGVFVMTLFMDTLIQPISPDLLVFSYAHSGEKVVIAALVGGLASVIAGVIGYGIGYFLGQEGVNDLIGKKKYDQVHYLFKKYGVLAVLVGALTPVPFSATCWAAGMFKMSFKIFIVVATLARFPRFLGMAYLGGLIG